MNAARAGFCAGLCALLALVLGCAGGPAKAFTPRSDYPTDPWVKGYAQKDDCLGGEKLAARSFALPDYPKGAFKRGLQGWVILRLDVDAQGVTQNIEVERAVPEEEFSNISRRAVKAWRFAPPEGGPLLNCRVLFRYKLGAVTLGS